MPLFLSLWGVQNTFKLCVCKQQCNTIQKERKLMRKNHFVITKFDKVPTCHSHSFSYHFDSTFGLIKEYEYAGSVVGIWPFIPTTYIRDTTQWKTKEKSDKLTMFTITLLLLLHLDTTHRHLNPNKINGFLCFTHSVSLEDKQNIIKFNCYDDSAVLKSSKEEEEENKDESTV